MGTWDEKTVRDDAEPCVGICQGQHLPCPGQLASGGSLGSGTFKNRRNHMTRRAHQRLSGFSGDDQQIT